MNSAAQTKTSQVRPSSARFLVICWLLVTAEVFLWPPVARQFAAKIGVGAEVLGPWLFDIVPGAIVFLLALTIPWLRAGPDRERRRDRLVIAFWIANFLLLVASIFSLR